MSQAIRCLHSRQSNTRGYGPYGPFCHAIKCNVHLEIVKLMLKNISFNILISRSFNFGTVVGGLDILPQATMHFQLTVRRQIIKPFMMV